MVLIWIPTLVLNAVSAGLDPGTPIWLEWVARIVWTIAVVVTATYLCLRGREVVTYRRRLRTGH